MNFVGGADLTYRRFSTSLTIRATFDFTHVGDLNATEMRNLREKLTLAAYNADEIVVVLDQSRDPIET